MTVAEALAEGTAELRGAGAESPSLDASLLLAAALGIDRSRLLARRPDPADDAALRRYRAFLARRASGDCVAYVLSSKEFRGLDFIVTPAVLVPRPDTEILVEAALEWIDRRERDGSSVRAARIRAADVCTGSGCVAVSLKAERPGLDMVASDLSEDALAVARSNALRLLGGTSIPFYRGDLLDAVPGRFDLIVSNPPYVPSAAIAGLAVEVRREPRMALDGGEDGLDLIRRLVADSLNRLDGGGRLLIESGGEQTDRVAELMREAGFLGIEIYRDLAGLGRVTGGSAPETDGGTGVGN